MGGSFTLPLHLSSVAPAILAQPSPWTGSGPNPLLWRSVASSVEYLIRTGNGCSDRAKAERAGRRPLVLGSGDYEKVKQLGQVST